MRRIRGDRVSNLADRKKQKLLSALRTLLAKCQHDILPDTLNRRGFLIGSVSLTVASSLGRLSPLIGRAQAQSTKAPSSAIETNEALVDQLMAKLNARALPTDQTFYWRTFPASDPDVIRYQERVSQTQDFNQWNKATPIPSGQGTRESIIAEIVEDLYQAIGKAKDITSDKRKKLVVGATNAFDMNKRQFEKFQKEHWRYFTRRKAAEKLTKQEINTVNTRIRANALASLQDEIGNPGPKMIEVITYALSRALA